MNQTFTKVKKICVIGFGPTAQAFIASMMQKASATPDVKYEITVIEKRNKKFQRRQRLIDVQPGALMCEESWEDFLTNISRFRNKMTEDGELLDDQNLSNKATNLNARQTFLRKLLRQSIVLLCRQTAVKNFSIKSLQEALLEQIESEQLENVTIKINFETIITELNLTKKTLSTYTLNGEDAKHEFDTLIICEGSKRIVVDQVKNAIAKEHLNVMPFEFESFSYQLPKYNAACLLTMNHSDLTKKRPGFSFTADGLRAKLVSLGWKSPNENVFLPMGIVDTNIYKEKLGMHEWKPAIFIVSEIPDCIASISDSSLRNEKILEWIKALASYHFQLPEECFQVSKSKDSNDDLAALSFFESDTQYVKHPVLTLPNDAQVVLLGDCSMSSVYRAGFSSSIGLNESIVAANCLIAKNEDPVSRFEPLNRVYQAFQQRVGRYLESSPYSHARFFQNNLSSSGKNDQFPPHQITALSK